MSRRLLSSRGVANRYGGVHLRTLNRWEDSGAIPKHTIRINHRKYWDEAILDEADRANTAAAGANSRPPSLPYAKRPPT
jgi:hypothetical protein